MSICQAERGSFVNKVWSDDEREYVRANAGTMTDDALAMSLTRIVGRPISRQAVRKQRQKMGLRKRHGRGVCGLVDAVPVVRIDMRRPLGVPLVIRAETEQGVGGAKPSSAL